MAGGVRRLWAWLTSNSTGFWGQETHRRILHFLGHFLSFVPTMLIAGMASLLVGAAIGKIWEFLFFTVATISLEVCFTCLRAKYIRVFMIQKRSDDHQALQQAWIEVAQCWVFVGAVVVSWIIVAFVEVGQMGQLNMIPQSKTVAGILAGFNFLTATYKMWTHAGKVVEETSLTEPATRSVANPSTSQPVPR